MDILNKLTEKLSKHPALKWVKDGDCIRVDAPCPEGFAVELHFSGDEWTVFLGNGGWHQHFHDGNEALEFIAWCYSGEARVREIRRGDMLQKSILEALTDDSWQCVAVVGYFVTPFWRRKTELILQNPNILSAGQPCFNF